MSRVNTKNRSGHTLVELMMAMGSATFLMGGLASTLYISSRALDGAGSAPVQTLETADTTDDVMADLQYALSFSERTANAVTFQVPDRDGDDSPETIRYSWSGTPGDPLLMEYNGGSAATLIDDVQQLDLTYLLRTMTGTGFAKGAIYEDTLVAHWKFDEQGGTTAFDSSEMGHDGFLSAGFSFGTSSVNGQDGKALNFNGGSDYVSVPNTPELQITTALSITAWIAGRSWGSYYDVDVIARKGEDNPINYLLAVQNGRLSLILDEYDGTSDYLGSTLLSTRRWYHVAGTWDGTEVRLYINGVLDNDPPPSRSGTIGTDNRPLYLGGRSGTDLFDGYLDDIRIYNRALSAEEVMQIKNGLL